MIVSEILQTELSRRKFLSHSGKAVGAAVLLSSPIIGVACGGETASGVLRYGSLEIFDSQNPVITVSIPDMHWLVYDRLMDFDEDLSPRLSMATDRQVSNGGTTITYTLREGVKFHDGTDLTSADVKFSMELYRDTGLSLFAGFFEPLETVDAPDATTVVLNFSGTPTLDPTVGAAILPQSVFGNMTREEIEQFGNDEMIGSGPFKFVSYQVDNQLELERNEDWWGWDSNGGPNQGTIQRMIKVKMANEETIANQLRANEIDVTTAIGTDVWDGLVGESNIEAVEYPALILDHFGINVYEDPDNPGQPHPDSGGNPLLMDRVVREAMSWAIDRQLLVDLVLGGRGLVGSVVVMPALVDSFLTIPADEQANGDPERARQLLEENGYIDRDGDGVRESPDGDKLSFRLFASTVADRLPQYAELIKPMLEAVGIEIEGPIGEDDPTLINRVFTEADWDMYTWVWTSPPDPTFMLSVQSCDQFGNLSDTYYCSEDYESIFKEQQTEGDAARRADLVKQAQRIFYDDFAYCVLSYPTKLMAYRTDALTGWPFINNGIVSNWSTETYLTVREA